ncbi:Regulator of Vps4 activity in the MVB pathway protein [Striga hermonthica]|uniref:Regulator of Vps4 activity in the MVB pathway protein n=1 Tax=Striga hermonthica TaxID=68872 RepID=A0A9N7MYS2_STRHE|nr:Regulator of Vps4 activity in the MVB pathway protein [Striga hermonthica]
MFDILFGWRKASKCKKLIKMARCRLKLVKNKRSCVSRQSRDDVAQLLKHGHHQIAFRRVEQVMRDESLIQVYDLLDLYCECLIFRFPYIRKCRDCPNDINEAASTLIYSSARFAELPELMPIRKLLGECYGQRFVKTALELLPGNLVNLQIKDYHLLRKKVTEDSSKYRLLAEIASDCMQQGPLLLEYDKSDDGDNNFVTPRCGAHHKDDVEEFVSPAKDQRLFVFRLFVNEKECYGWPEIYNNNNINKFPGQDYYSDEDFQMPSEKEGEEIGIEWQGLRTVVSMPCERPKPSFEDGNIMSIIPFPCRHIHPKLPDYDELAEKFKALKREKQHGNMHTLHSLGSVGPALLPKTGQVGSAPSLYGAGPGIDIRPALTRLALPHPAPTWPGPINNSPYG